MLGSTTHWNIFLERKAGQVRLCSEAVLIGMCLEEYLQAWDDDKNNASIFGFIDTRLRPFTLEMATYATTEI